MTITRQLALTLPGVDEQLDIFAILPAELAGHAAEWSTPARDITTWQGMAEELAERLPDFEALTLPAQGLVIGAALAHTFDNGMMLDDYLESILNTVQFQRSPWLDPGVIGPGVPVTHRLELDDVEVYRGSFAACALTLSSRFTGHSLEILARLDPTAAELSRRLTDDEWSDLRRFRNCAKFAERLEEPGADEHGVSLALEAGGMTYRLSPIGDEQ